MKLDSNKTSEDNQQSSSDVITNTIRLLNEQCAKSQQGFWLRRFLPISNCDFVLVLEVDWTEDESKQFFETGASPEGVFDIETQEDARPHWFFDITEKWTALPKVKFEKVPDFERNPATIVLVGLEGIETKICCLETQKLEMKMLGEKEVQFAWAEDGMSSLYHPLENGYDLVEANFAPDMQNLRTEDDV